MRAPVRIMVVGDKSSGEDPGRAGLVTSVNHAGDGTSSLTWSRIMDSEAFNLPRAEMNFNMSIHGLSGNMKWVVDHPVKSARARRAV